MSGIRGDPLELFPLLKCLEDASKRTHSPTLKGGWVEEIWRLPPGRCRKLSPENGIFKSSVSVLKSARNASNCPTLQKKSEGYRKITFSGLNLRHRPPPPGNAVAPQLGWKCVRSVSWANTHGPCPIQQFAKRKCARGGRRGLPHGTGSSLQ